MNSKRITYISLGIVFAISLPIAIFGPREFIQELAAIPMVVALVAAIFQILRDQAGHERALLAADHQNRFVLGVSSHMANIAFDKHVEFCEEYIKEAHEALRTIFRDGPSSSALKHSTNLFDVREKFAVWMTSEIEKDLEPFETALRKMGASAGYVDSTTGNTEALQRPQHINRMYKLLAQLTDQKEWEGEELTDELAVSWQIRRLRAMLGTEELSKMRQIIIDKAAKELRA